MASVIDTARAEPDEDAPAPPADGRRRLGRFGGSRLGGLILALNLLSLLILFGGALAQRPGFVKSRDNLMDAAYDDQVYVDDRTIDSHVKRMRKKFRVVDPEFDAIETLYGVGYRYRES